MTHNEFGIVVILVYFAACTNVNAVGIGASCNVNADCMVTNYDSHCYHWFTSESCSNGICRCNEGHGGNTCDRSLAIQGHHQECNSTAVCDMELHCNATIALCTCATTTYVYKDTTKLCLATDSRVVGETCTNSSDCYNWSGASGGIECNGSNMCQCKAGYVQTNGLCYTPYYGQACNTVVGCTQMSHPGLVINDGSRVTEQCESGVCVCPSGSEVVAIDTMGALLVYCVQAPTSILKATGRTCTLSNQCMSRVCATCPGASQNIKRCLDAGSNAQKEVPGLASMLMALAAIVFTYTWSA